MKKTVAILLITTLVFSLVACSVKDTSSKYSSADFSASNTSVLPAIKQEVESANINSTSSMFTNSNKSSSVSSPSSWVDSYVDDYSTPTDENNEDEIVPVWYSKSYGHNYSGDMQEFVEWTKTGGDCETKIKRNFRQTPFNRPFLDWSKKQDKLLVAKPISKKSKECGAKLKDQLEGYSVKIQTDKKDVNGFVNICVDFWPILDNDVPELNLPNVSLALIKYAEGKHYTSDSSDWTPINDFLDFSTRLSSFKSDKFDRYFRFKEDYNHMAAIVYDNYLVVVRAYDYYYDNDNNLAIKPFDEKWFNYFNLEYVSLEN